MSWKRITLAGVVAPVIVISAMLILGTPSKPAKERWRTNKAYNADGSLRRPAFDAPPRDSKPSVDAIIYQDGLKVMVLNDSQFDWGQTMLCLDDELGPRYNISGLAKGKSIVIPLIEFATHKGERFQPRQRKARHLIIYVSGCDGVRYTFRN